MVPAALLTACVSLLCRKNPITRNAVLRCPKRNDDDAPFMLLKNPKQSKRPRKSEATATVRSNPA